MSNGRPPKPQELKQIQGTYRPSRAVDGSGLLVPQSDSQPEMPEGLSLEAQRLWSEFWSVNWISQKTDYQIVLMTCQTISEREAVRAALAENPQDRLTRISLRELDKQVISLLSLLGFSPADRQRLGVTEVKVKSKLQDLLEAKAAAGK